MTAAAWAAIATFLGGLGVAIPVLLKYLPKPKTEADQEASDNQDLAQAVNQMKKDGRP
jgi:hypothetical protein